MKLLIITETYPYSGAREATFLDPEMAVLGGMVASGEVPFEVYVAPLAARGAIDSMLPQRFQLVDWFSRQGKLEAASGISAVATAHVLYEAGFGRGRASGHDLQSRFQQAIRWTGMYSRVRRGLREHGQGEAWCYYTYWFCPATSACIDFARIKRHKVVSRAHGIDLFDERLYHPRREFDLKRIDRVFPVSARGTAYLRAAYGVQDNIETQYLGIDAHPESGCSHDPLAQQINIVSCAYLAPVKRIPLLCKGLIELARRRPDIAISWHHIGDGPDAEQLLKLLECSPLNLVVELKGNVANHEFRAMLRSYHYDWIVNVSESEGLPVSLMEAAEAGIPIIATDVGGSAEIVGDAGILLPADPSPLAIADAIERIPPHERKSRGAAARRAWEATFNARKNHRAFFEKLREICS